MPSRVARSLSPPARPSDRRRASAGGAQRGVPRTDLLRAEAIVVLSAIIPWQQAGLMEARSCRCSTWSGFPYAADLMNFVILTAILSVGNSGLYASTRDPLGDVQDRHGPARPCRLSARGVPLYALLITLCFALLSLLTSVVAADTLFMVLMAVSGMSGTVTWIVIAYAQYRFRREYWRPAAARSPS
ncbi:hypothetical protein ACPA9J_05410 [Pseudomonas aeruginosa]